MGKHTPDEIIDQCILRWRLSAGYGGEISPQELEHHIWAAETIKDELKSEGY